MENDIDALEGTAQRAFVKKVARNAFQWEALDGADVFPDEGAYVTPLLDQLAGKIGADMAGATC